MNDTNGTAKYIVLKGITDDNWMCSFFTTYNPNRDQTMREGVQVYKVLGHVNSTHDAQVLLYGKCHSTCMNGEGNCRE